MKFSIESSADAEHDFELIFDHLFESYRSFGESIEEALDHAARRIDGIRQSANKLLWLRIAGRSTRMCSRGCGTLR